MPDRKDKRTEVTDPALLEQLNAGTGTSNRQEVTDPVLLAQLNGEEQATPQKKSPVASEAPVASSSMPLQNGATTNSANIFDIDPMTGLSRRAPANKTESATDYIAKDYLTNIGAPEGIDVNNPQHPLNQVTDPHGDPSYLSNYVKGRLATIEQKRKAEQTDITLHGVAENPQDPYPQQQAIDQKYGDEKQQLLSNAGHVMALQLFNKEYQTENPSGKGYKYNPILLGAEYAANLGDPQAQSDLLSMKSGKGINPLNQYKYNLQGNKVIQEGTDATINEKAKEEGEQHADRTGKRLFENNKQFLVESGAQAVGNAKYEEENPLMQAIRSTTPSQVLPGATDADIEEYGKKLGLDERVIEELKKDPAKIPKQASFVQQFQRGAFNAAAPIYEQAVRHPGLLGPAGLVMQHYQNQEAVNDMFQPGWENQRGVGAVIAGNTPSDQNSFSNVRGAVGQMFEGAGNLATFAGEVGGLSKGIEGLGLAEKTSEKLANFGLMSFQGYNDAYKKSLDVIGDNPDDEGKRQLYSLINGLATGTLFSISPKSQLIKNALGIESKSGEELLKAIQKNGGPEFMQTAEGQSMGARYIQEFGKELGTQVSLATAQKLFENISNTVFNPQRKQDLGQDLKETAISTALTMFLPSLGGAFGHVNEQTPFNNAAMFEVGSNPEKYLSHTSQQLQDGKISPQEAQVSHDAIIGMKGAIANTPTSSPEGKPLSPNQIKQYSYNLFQEQLLTKAIKSLEGGANTTQTPVDKAQVDPLKKRISELQGQRSDILTNPGTDVVAPKKQKGKETTADVGDAVHDYEKKIIQAAYKKGEEFEPQDLRHLEKTKENPEGFLDWKIESVQDLINSELEVPKPDKSYIKYLNKRLKDYTGLQDRFKAAKENEQSIEAKALTGANAENPQSEEETSATKESSEKLAQTEKENIPLSSQEESQQKTPENGKSNDNIGKQEEQQATNENGQEGSGAEKATNGENRNEQQEAGVLKKPEEENASQATPQEQPIPVSGRKKRKFAPENPVSEPVQQKEYAAMDYGTEAGKPAEEVDKKVKAAAPDEKIGGGESFNEFKDRIQKAWENTNKTAEDKTQFMMHSTVMRLIESAEKVGWDSPDLREEFNKTKEPDPAEKQTYKLADNKGEVDLYRHAESEDGKDKLSRTPETPLTAKGEGEAKEIADNIKQEGIVPPAIVAGGEEVRTNHTAAIVANEINQGTEPSTERRNEVKSEQQAPATKTFTKKDIKKTSDAAIISSQFQKGDKITFFTDGKERTGIWNGKHAVDKDKNPWGILGILSGEKDWMRNDGQPLKNEQNASTSIKKQQQESGKQGGKSEHARAQQVGSETKAAETKNSDSNIGGKKKEKVKATANRHQMDFGAYNANKKFVEESGFEPSTSEEHVLMHMAQGGRFRMGTEEVPGIEKHLPTRSGTPENSATREKWLTDHESKNEVYDKALKKNVPVADADKMLYNAGIDDAQNQANTAEVISQHNTQGEVYQRLADIIREKQKAEESPKEMVHLTYVDPQTGDHHSIELDPHSPTFENDLSHLMGTPREGEPVAFDEDHPVFQEGIEQNEAIRKADMTQGDKDLLDELWNQHTDDAGKLNIVNFANALHENKDKFTGDIQAIIEKIQPFEDNEYNTPHIEQLKQKISKYEADNSKTTNDGASTGPETAGGIDRSQPGSPGESGNESTDTGTATEKPIVAPGPERSIAENPQSEKKPSATKNLSPNELVRKKQLRLGELQDQHVDLNEEKEALELKLNSAEAASKPDEEVISEIKNQVAELNAKIKDKQTAIKLKEREIEIQKGYASSANNMRKGLDKLIKDSDKDIFTSGLSKQSLKDVLNQAIDLYEKFGNIHIAVLRSVEWAKQHIFGEDEAVDQLKEEHIRNLLSPYILPAKEEPVIRQDDHLQMAREVLADIENGHMTHSEAREDILDSEGISDKTKGNILNWIDWHLEGRGDKAEETKKEPYSGEEDETSIKNDATRLKREQFGLNEEFQAGKKEWGPIWDDVRNKIENEHYDPQTLVDALAKKSRPITDKENAILLHLQVTLENKFRDLNDKINDAAEQGDQASVLEYKTAKSAVLDKLQKLYDVDKAVGTENARGLAARRMASDRKYTLTNMMAEKRATANDGQPLTEEQQAHIEALHQKIQETQDAADTYRKEKEAQILELQRKLLVERQDKAAKGNTGSAQATATPGSAIESKQSKSKVVADKLRKWADNNDKKSKGNTYASIVPITPKMISDAVRLVADGIEKGGELLDHIQKVVGKIKNTNPGIDETHLEREINQAIIDAGIVPPSIRTKAIQLMSGFFKNGKLDDEAVRLNVAANRAKAEFDVQIKKDQQGQLSSLSKVQNSFIKWERTFKLSNPLTMGKLATAGLTRLATTPLEDIVGGAYSAILPQLARGAIGEGGGLNVRETADAYKTFITKGMKDASEIMKKGSGGKSDLDVLFGKIGDLPPEAIDFFGQLHSATKAPIKRVLFERSLSKRLRRNIDNGVDVSDPMVQTSIMNGAYKDANRSIFMQDNKVAYGYQRLIRQLENNDMKGVATGLQWLLPFVKVPSNIVAETGTHIYGLPVAAAKLLHAAFTNGIENLPEEQKEVIMRNLKKGTLGVAAMALGYFNPQNFGGYYQAGEKRQEEDADAMGLKIFGQKLPSWLSESPIFQAMQFGSTVRRLADKYVDGEQQGIPEGLRASLLDVVQENPLANQPLRLGSIFHSKREFNYYMGELAKSTVDPALVTYLAKVTDPADEGSWVRKALDPYNKRKSPKTIIEHIQSGIPGWREGLEEK